MQTSASISASQRPLGNDTDLRKAAHRAGCQHVVGSDRSNQLVQQGARLRNAQQTEYVRGREGAKAREEHERGCGSDCRSREERVRE
eukprot:355319-Chlamydomonas_euryale.AAC.2